MKAWGACALVLAQPFAGIAQVPAPKEEQVECIREISVKVGNGVLQSICESRPEWSGLRHKIVIARLHPSGSGIEMLAEYPFERECEWSSDWVLLTCSPQGWSPLAGAVFRKSSVKGCKSSYVCETGCGGERTPKQLTVTDLPCQNRPPS